MVLLLVCTGCASAPPKMNTASGRPETTFPTAGVDLVKDRIASELINRGYMIMRTEGALIIGQKDAGLGVQMLLGSASRRPQIEARFNVVPTPAGTRAVGSLVMTGVYAQEADFNGARSNTQIQYMLDCIRADLEHTPRPPAPEPPPPVDKVQSPRAAAK